MSDIYSQAVNSLPGRVIAPRLGLPRPIELERHEAGAPVVSGPVLVGAAPGGRLTERLKELLTEIGGGAPTGPEEPVKALVFDATGISDSTELVELQRFFHPNVKRIARCGRVIVLGTPPAGRPAREATAQRASGPFAFSTQARVRATPPS